MDASFIFLLSFVGFMAFAFKIGYKKSLAHLDQQIKDVAHLVQEAQDSLSQAQERYAQEHKTQALIQHEIEEIFKKNHHQIVEIQSHGKKELAQLMENKIKSSQTRMDRMREEVMDELKTSLSHQIGNIMESLFTHHTDKLTQETLNNEFLKQLETIFPLPQNADSNLQKKAVNQSE